MSRNKNSHRGVSHPALYRFTHNYLAVASVLILLVIILLSVFAPYLTPYEFEATDLLQIRKPPSQKHLLGTDSVGRDVLTRLLYAGRISILVGISTALIQVLLGTVLGAVSGYYGGAIDQVLSRIADALLSFPFFVIAMSVTAIIGRGTDKLI